MGVRPLPVTAGDFAEGRRAVLRSRDAADPGSCRVARSGGRAAGRVPDGIQHASLGHVERGPGAADCRAGWGDGRAGLRAVGGRALPVFRGYTQPADPTPGGGPPTTQVPALLSVPDRSRV